MRNSLPRRHRLAFALALLAVLAQLWMVQASTRHMGQMLWQQTLWGDVCTAHNSPLAAADPASDTEHPPQLSSMAHCPVCSAAGAGPAPLPTQTTPLAAQESTPYRMQLATVPARTLRHASLRPPAQAPPRA